MDIKFYKVMSVFIIALTLVILFTQMRSKTDLSFAQTGKFSHLVPFITDNGRMCFFDQNDGKVYLYDENLKKCLFIFQLQELGKDMEKIK